MIKNDTYTLKVDIETEHVLKQLRTIKKEVKETVKECSFELDKFSLKRRDILVIKLKGIIKDKEKIYIENQIKKKIHRKVLCIDDRMDLSIVER